MNIKSTVRITKVNQNTNREMQKLLSSNDHFAWSEDIDKEISFEGQKHKFKLIEAPYLRTFSLDNVEHIESHRIMRKEYIALGKIGCGLAQQCFPELVDRPVDGIKLLIASSQAYDAWTDQSPDYVFNGSVATGKAFLHAFDVIEPFFPVLQQYSTHKQVIKMLLQVADSIYVLEKQQAARQTFLRG